MFQASGQAVATLPINSIGRNMETSHLKDATISAMINNS
jgi:hypothetical protein